MKHLKLVQIVCWNMSKNIQGRSKLSYRDMIRRVTSSEVTAPSDSLPLGILLHSHHTMDVLTLGCVWTLWWIPMFFNAHQNSSSGKASMKRSTVCSFLQNLVNSLPLVGHIFGQVWGRNKNPALPRYFFYILIFLAHCCHYKFANVDSRLKSSDDRSRRTTFIRDDSQRLKFILT